MARLKNNVSVDGSGFGEFEISVDEVGQVGEVQSKVLFVFSVPLVPLCVLSIFELGSGVGCEKSWDLAEASNFPVSEFHFGHLG